MLRGWLGVQKSVLLFIPLKTQGPILLFTFFTASKPLLSKLIWNLPTGQFCWVFSISSFHLPSVQFSCSVMSDSLRPYGLRHARPPCPSPTPGACSNSCPLSRWCDPTISSSVVPFSSCLQSFPGSGYFLVSPLPQVAKILELQLQHQSFQWIFRIDIL